MNELTNKTWVVEYHNGLRFYLSDEEKNFMIAEFAKGTKQVVFDEKVLTPGFAFCVKATELLEADNKKLGNWKCGYGFWHGKDERCQHKNKEPNLPKMDDDQRFKNQVKLEAMKFKYLEKQPIPEKLLGMMKEVGLKEEDI